MKDKTIFGNNKILQHIDRIQEYKKKGIVPPITMELDLTDYCNHKCPQCAGGRQQNKMSYESVEKYLWDISSYGTKAITFTGGGEPLIHPNALNAVATAKQLGMDVGFITNGGLLDKKKSQTLLNYCTWIRVSLDAYDAHSFEKTHGMPRSEYVKVRNNIMDLGMLKKRMDSNCTVGVGYLTNKITKPGMIPTARELAWSGVDYLQFRPFHGDFTSIDDVIEDCKRFETKNYKVLASTQKYSHFKDKFKRDYSYCHGSNFVGVIQANSDVTLCCHTRGKKQYVLGNLKEESFKSIWEGEKKKKILEKLDVNKCVPYCRCDGFNRTLDDIMTPKQHENFL